MAMIWGASLQWLLTPADRRDLEGKLAEWEQRIVREAVVRGTE
jgi:hypothetical protein